MRRRGSIARGRSDLAVVDVLDAGVDGVVDVLHLLAEQLVVAGVAEAGLDLAVDQLDLLDHRVLQLSQLGRGNRVQPRDVLRVVAEDRLLLELLHPRPHLLHHPLDGLNLPRQLLHSRRAGVARAQVDHPQHLLLPLEHLLQPVPHQLHYLGLLYLRHTAIIPPQPQSKLIGRCRKDYQTSTASWVGSSGSTVAVG